VRHAVPSCRVIARRATPGAAPDAGVDQRAPGLGAAFDGEHWVDIGGGTEVVLRFAETTRELALRGPGRFLPCFLGSETVLVASGSIKTTAGAGARAGAEVVLGSPFGTLHFSDAMLVLDVRAKELEVSIETGAATLVPPVSGGDGGPGDLALVTKSKKKLAGPKSAKELVADCSVASLPLRAPPPIPPPGPSARALAGQWAVEQLKARQAARWACATARAAIGREEGSERHRLWDQINSLDRVWQAAPSLGLDAGK
jgi:hypothetical protein